MATPSLQIGHPTYAYRPEMTVFATERSSAVDVQQSKQRKKMIWI